MKCICPKCDNEFKGGFDTQHTKDINCLLGYFERLESKILKIPVARRTGAKEGIGMGEPWNHKKCPLKWEDQ